MTDHTQATNPKFIIVYASHGWWLQILSCVVSKLLKLFVMVVLYTDPDVNDSPNTHSTSDT